MAERLTDEQTDEIERSIDYMVDHLGGGKLLKDAATALRQLREDLAEAKQERDEAQGLVELLSVSNPMRERR